VCCDCTFLALVGVTQNATDQHSVCVCVCVEGVCDPFKGWDGLEQQRLSNTLPCPVVEPKFIYYLYITPFPCPMGEEVLLLAQLFISGATSNSSNCCFILGSCVCAVIEVFSPLACITHN